MRKTIAFIPARGGSKSIPKKNIKPFFNKPLILWNIEVLLQVEEITTIVIATDSQEIAETIPKNSKIEIYWRKDENARDHSSTEAVMLEYLDQAEYDNQDYFMLVQATSPFTSASDFEKGLQMMKSYDSVLSGTLFKRFLWNNSYQPINYDFKNRPRRQDFEGNLIENGAFYINSITNILGTKNRLSGDIGMVKMPEYTALELDEPLDWKIGELIMANHLLESKSIDNATIKLFITDVDGVLTDSGMYYTENGDELKKFSTYDGMGIEILRKHSIKTAIITGEDTKLVERRSNKLKFDYLFMGIKNKVEVAEKICEQENISLNEVAFIGDDVNDYELLTKVGVKACPANAVLKIKSIPGIIKLQKEGGKGVVREFIEYLNYE